MLVDLHSQTVVSGSRKQDPARVIDQARSAGLDGVAFVDRLHSGDAAQLVAAGEAADFPVFVGVEIPAAAGRFLCFPPEIDPFLTREEWRQLMAVLMPPTVSRIVQLFDDIGGAVLAAQPYARENGVRLGDSLVFCEGLVGVESLTPVHTRTECMMAVEAAVKMGLPLAGGSSGGQEIGRFATLFSAPVTTQSELVEALRAGNFWGVQIGDSQPRRRSSSRGRSRSKRRGGGGERTSRSRRRRRRRGPRDN